MKISRPAVWMFVVAAIGLYIVRAHHGGLLHRSLQIGDMDWIYMGNNVSVIQYAGKTIVGPCRLEIMERDHFVYGNSDEDESWFVIDKNTHHVARGDDLDNICKEIGASYPVGRFRFETFLTRWNLLRQ